MLLGVPIWYAYACMTPSFLLLAVTVLCAGLGAQFPDAANASRRMKADEFATCQQNGVKDIVEIQVGLDGLVFASAKGGIELNLTPEIVYKAIADSTVSGVTMPVSFEP